MTLFHEKMTPLLAETPVSGSDWLESAISLPGIGGLLHSCSGGFTRAQAGDCPEKGGRERRGLKPEELSIENMYCSSK
jgi:hypothetical protein